jgi:RNA polymerase sigma-70 factor, ECF subfamily
LAIDWPAIVREHGPLVWKTAYRLLLNEADVSDCFQETFVSALEISKRQNILNWGGLLQRIASARALDLLRARIRKRASGDDVMASEAPSHSADPVQEAEAAELSDRLRVALTQLPPTQSQAFCLRHLSGLEYEEIASEMGITIDAAGAMIHRAREHLKEILLGSSPIAARRK